MNCIKYPVICFLLLLTSLSGCRKKEKIEFTLNSLTLKSDKLDSLPKQNLFLKVFKTDNSTQEDLATTGKYPSEYTLPVKYGLENPVKMNFYKHTYAVALYGDSSGFIGSNTVNIHDYKILYPLDMETKNNGLEIVLSGTWR